MPPHDESDDEQAIATMMEPLPLYERLYRTYFRRDPVVPLFQWARILEVRRERMITAAFVRLRVQAMMVVKSQMISLNSDADMPHSFQPYSFRVSTHVAAIGTSSVEVISDVYGRFHGSDAPPGDADQLIVRAVCVLVVVTPDRSKTAKVPEGFAEVKHGDHHPLKGATKLIRNVQPPSKSNKEVYRRPLMISYSDEDALHHMNQSNYVKYFEDAVQEVRHRESVRAKHPRLVELVDAHTYSTILVDYVREATASKGPYELVLTEGAEGDGTLDAFILSEAEGTHSRGKLFHTLPPVPKIDAKL